MILYDLKFVNSNKLCIILRMTDEKKPKIGGIYKHFKGNIYKVIDIVRHSETTEEMVLYKPLYKSKDFPNQMWVRPIEMFLEIIESDGKKIPRFKLIEK